jgi:hypothetical protein
MMRCFLTLMSDETEDTAMRRGGIPDAHRVKMTFPLNSESIEKVCRGYLTAGVFQLSSFAFDHEP